MANLLNRKYRPLGVRSPLRYNGVETSGPVLVIYGDSISTGTHGAGGYEPALRKALRPSIIHNHAVGGSGLSAVTPNSLVTLLERADHRHPEADLILLWHGSNDWYWGAEAGSLDVEDPHTFRGAMVQVVRILRAVSPRAVLMWPTPIWRRERPDGCTGQVGEAWDTPNKKGCTLREITGCIEEGSRRHCFTAPDMRRLSGIHPGTAPFLLEDDVHPNAEGYQRISAVLLAEFRKWSGYQREVP